GFFVGFLASVFIAPLTLADEEKEEGPWRVAAEVGVIATSGNTETTTVQGKLDATHDMERWNNQYILSVLFKEDEIPQDDGTTETEKTAERYSASIKSAYKLEREHSNLFVFGSHTDD